jgi:hypothetical protein
VPFFFFIFLRLFLFDDDITKEQEPLAVNKATLPSKMLSAD